MEEDEETQDYDFVTSEELIDHLYDRVLVLQQFVVEHGLTEDQFIEWQRSYEIRKTH